MLWLTQTTYDKYINEIKDYIPNLAVNVSNQLNNIAPM